jgi:hypothetical protein
LLYYRRHLCFLQKNQKTEKKTRKEKLIICRSISSRKSHKIKVSNRKKGSFVPKKFIRWHRRKSVSSEIIIISFCWNHCLCCSCSRFCGVIKVWFSGNLWNISQTIFPKRAITKYPWSKDTKKYSLWFCSSFLLHRVPFLQENNLFPLNQPLFFCGLLGLLRW